MNAFDKLMRAVEQAISKGTRHARRGRGRKVAKRTATQSRPEVLPGKPVVRHERGAFSRVLQAGQVPVLRQALDEFAVRGSQVELYAGHGHTSSEPVRRNPVGRPRKSAHAGDDTTTGLERDATEAA